MVKELEETGILTKTHDRRHYKLATFGLNLNNKLNYVEQLYPLIMERINHAAALICVVKKCGFVPTMDRIDELKEETMYTRKIR